MLFKQEMIDAILAGKKTQTRRVIQHLESVTRVDGSDAESDITTVYDKHSRTKWRVGQSYAIQPGRGKGGIYARLAMSGKYEWQTTQPDGNGGAQWQSMRILVTAIRREPLHAITESDAQAEGVKNVAEYQALWERINGAASWRESPDVWVLEFELVKGVDR